VTDTPACPVCSSEFTYELAGLLTCPECAHEWTIGSPDEATAVGAGSDAKVVRDAVGNPLADGDDVIIVKDLKIKGSATSIKVGTKVRGIRLVDGAGDHDIDCKVDGFGPMMLKSSVVKKA
jgi:protein PhnA